MTCDPYDCPACGGWNSLFDGICEECNHDVANPVETCCGCGDDFPAGTLLLTTETNGGDPWLECRPCAVETIGKMLSDAIALGPLATPAYFERSRYDHSNDLMGRNEVA